MDSETEKIAERVAGRVMTAGGGVVSEYITFDENGFRRELMSLLAKSLQGKSIFNNGEILVTGDRSEDFTYQAFIDVVFAGDQLVLSYRFVFSGGLPSKNLDEKGDVLWVPLKMRMEQIVGVIGRKFAEQRKRWEV